MSLPIGDGDFLHGLQAEVEAELVMAESSGPEEEMSLPVTEWLYDPADARQEEIELRGLLGAVEALEDGPGAGHIEGGPV
ncbi:hypothetical protein Sme01_50080 [Sphaerisporangium melleum]|uniref:Uncharacterized protein n=1 Tax=Sphaerisporangium melleum TaxID=321316 RepID=A0A917R4Z0_9ACTN|nr:hypothetical protein [Sphaerisporangium melleum]GGK89735.1 hypothetical protein GCM10007964_35490 [Sphaerisporangium melleum]GII72532.1 hypothetical protein Sme01_50080 [Sphaerisporangium melleum]